MVLKSKNLLILLPLVFLVVSCAKKTAGTAAKSPEPAKASVPTKSSTADNSSDSKAIDILKSYISAIGGTEKIKGISSVMMKMGANTSMGEILITQFFKSGKMAMKTEMGGNVVMEQKFDGNQLEVSGMGGTQILNDAATIKATKKQARMFDEMDQLNSDLVIKKYLGVEKINGLDANKLSITDEDKNSSTQYFDAVSNLLVRTISTVDVMGQKGTQTMDMSDYKTVNGVSFPHSIKMSGGAIPFPMEMKITSLMINSDLPDALFKIN